MTHSRHSWFAAIVARIITAGLSLRAVPPSGLCRKSPALNKFLRLREDVNFYEMFGDYDRNPRISLSRRIRVSFQGSRHIHVCTKEIIWYL
jgi:hypothetical protein